MDNKNPTFADRLREFIIINYKNQSSYAKMIDISTQRLSGYVRGISFPDIHVFNKIINSGCSINWLMAGIGTMYSDNEAGNQLKSKIYPYFNSKTARDPDQKLDIIEIQLRWIILTHETLKEFCKIRSLDYNMWRGFFYGGGFLDPCYFEVLENSGCNKEWMMGKSDKIFNKTSNGLRLIKIFGDINSSVIKFIDPTAHDVYDRITKNDIQKIVSEAMYNYDTNRDDKK